METVSVRCNHCGAPLEVDAETRFVTCQFCHSSLEVKRTGTSLFTQEIEKIARNTEHMAGSLEVIELQNEIERLDREWMAGNPVSFDKNGRPLAEPSTGGAIFQMAFTVFFAIVCLGMAGSMASFGGGGFAIVPVCMAIFAIVASIMGMSKAGGHQKRKEAYLQQREEMVARLEARRKS